MNMEQTNKLLLELNEEKATFRHPVTVEFDMPDGHWQFDPDLGYWETDQKSVDERRHDGTTS